MSEKQKYYITTAIAYTSGKPHIGNTYEIVLADAIARYKRSQGYDVFFQTGTDEHGQKIELKAEEAGVTPKEFVDGVSAEIKKIWDLMDTSYDKFIRTTDEDHEKQVQKIFKKLYDGPIAINFQYFSAADFAVRAHDIHQFVIFDALHALHQHERPNHFADRFIFLKHRRRLPAPALSTAYSSP